MTIAIIGGGLSGTLTAIRLLNQATGPLTVYLIEQDRYRVYRGTAYSSQLSFQPLNVPASAMSLYPEEPDDFFTWLQQHQQDYANHLTLPVTSADFVPRYIFGDYVKNRLQQAQAQAATDVKLQHIYDEAVSVQQFNGSYHISFKDTFSVTADKVVLAFGNFAPAPLPIPNQAFYTSKRYFPSPWSAKVLYDLKPSEPVLLIGSSLTMVDLVGSLQAQQHKGKIYVVSRHGLLPQAFCVNTPVYPEVTIPRATKKSALKLFRFIRDEIAFAETAGYTWRSVLDALRDAIPAIWQAFPVEEKRRFLRHIRPYWEVHRHRMPASSASIVNKQIEENQLHLMAARITDMQETADQVQVTLLRKSTSTSDTIYVNRVINCTGPQTDFTRINKPLIQQLLHAKLIKPDGLHLGLETTPDGTLIGPDNMPVPGLLTLGPPRKGMLYESTALREIRKQATELVEHLLSESSKRNNFQQDAIVQ